MSKPVLLCLREDLVSPSVPLKQLATDVSRLVDSPIPEIAEKDALKAFEFIKDNKGKVPKDGDGKRVLVEGDPIRPDVCRMLLHMPLVNLLRREERVSATNPNDAVIHEDVVASSVSNVDKRNPRKRETAKPPSNVPPHTVEVYEKPDENAFDGFIGNEEVVRIVKEQLMGALKRGDPMPMILLRGPSGVGKTEVVHRIAKLLGRTLYYVSGAVLKSGDDIRLIEEDASTQPGSLVLLIDEGQGAGEGAQTAILTAQKDLEALGVRDAIIILATNLSGKLLGAVKNRCLEIRLREYTVEELMRIVDDTAKSFEVAIENGVARYIAERCHGIARYAKNHMTQLTTSNAGSDKITLAQAKDFFDLRGVDDLGLRAEHRQYILQLYKLGHASITALAAALGENDTSEIASATEPLLLKHGLISITSKGRMLTETGRQYAEAIASKEA